MTAAQAVYHNQRLSRRPGHVVVVAQRPRVLENLRSCSTRHALTGVVRQHYGYFRHDGSALIDQHSLSTTAILLAFSRWRDRPKYQTPHRC